jgi:hypothetical protein
MTSSEGFQHHFTIISKFVCCGCFMKKNVAFTLTSFAVLKWDDCLSVQVPFQLPAQIPVQLLLELEANRLDQNVNELEFELKLNYCSQTELNFLPWEFLLVKKLEIEKTKTTFIISVLKFVY